MRSVNMFLNASNNVNILSTSNTKIQSLNSRVHMSGELGINISAIGTGGNINLNADTTGGSIQLLSDGTSGTIAFDASLVLTNTGAALGTPIAITPDQGATTSGAQTMAFTTNRVPLHEPWGRTMISKSTTGDNTPGSLSDISSVLAVTKDSSILELSYHDVFNGVVEYGEDLGRNSFWRR